MYTTQCPSCKQVMGVGVIPLDERKKNPNKVYTCTCPHCNSVFVIQENGSLKKLENKEV